MPRHMALVLSMGQAHCCAQMFYTVGPPGAHRVPLGARNCSNAEEAKQILALLVPPEQQLGHCLDTNGQARKTFKAKLGSASPIMLCMRMHGWTAGNHSGQLRWG